MLKHLPPPNPGPRPGRTIRTQQPLNVSALSAVSLGSAVGSTPNAASNQPPPLPPMNHAKQHLANGPRLSSLLNTPLTSVSSSTNLIEKPEKTSNGGAKEALTSLGLLCLGEKNKLIHISCHLIMSLSPSSIVIVGPVVAYIPAQNIPGWTRVASRSHTGRRLHTRVRCHAGLMCTLLVPKPVLPPRLCDPVPVRGETREGGN